MKQVIKNNTQVLRFSAVGIVNTAIDFGLLFTLKALGLPVIPANIASSTTAFIFSFFANKKYTFKSHGGNLVREIVLFTIVTLFGLWVIQSVVIYVTYPWISELTNSTSSGLLISKLIATIASLLWNYTLYSLVVFKKP